MNKKDFIRGVGVGVLATSIIVGGFSLAGHDRTRNPQNESNKNHIASESPLDREETETPQNSAGPAQTADVTAKPSQSPAPTASGVPASEAPKNTQTPGTAAPEATKAPGSGQSGQASGDGQTAGQSGQTSGDSQTAGQSGQTSGNGQTTGSGAGSSPAASKAPGQSERPALAENYTLEIPKGADSYTVASKLEDAGIVGSAREFDDYLVERGYAEKLVQGSFEISKSDTYDQIARKITGRVK